MVGDLRSDRSRAESPVFRSSPKGVGIQLLEVWSKQQPKYIYLYNVQNINKSVNRYVYILVYIHT